MCYDDITVNNVEAEIGDDARILALVRGFERMSCRL